MTKMFAGFALMKVEKKDISIYVRKIYMDKSRIDIEIQIHDKKGKKLKLRSKGRRANKNKICSRSREKN